MTISVFSDMLLLLMNHFFKGFLLFIVLTIIGIPLHAKESPFIFFAQFTNENGLPQNSVKSIAEDEHGFIWLATEQGLVRYDGKEFKLFNNLKSGAAYWRPIVIIQTSPGNHTYAHIEENFFLPLKSGSVGARNSGVFDTIGAVADNLWSGYYPYKWDYSTKYELELDTLELHLGNRKLARIINKTKEIEFYDNKVHYSTVKHPLLNTSNRRYFILSGNLYCFTDTEPYAAYEVLADGKMIKRFIYGDILHTNDKSTIFPFFNSGSNQLYFYQSDHLYYITIDDKGNLHTEFLLSGFELEKKDIRSAHYNKAAGKLFLGSAFEGLYIFNKRLFSAITAPSQYVDNNVYYNLLKVGEMSFMLNNGMQVEKRMSGTYEVSPLFYRNKNTVYREMRKDFSGRMWVTESHDLHLLDEQNQWVKTFEKINLNQLELLDKDTFLLTLDLFKTKIFKATYTNGAFTYYPFLDLGDKVQMVQKIDDYLWIALFGKFFKYNLKTNKLELLSELNEKFVRFIMKDKDRDGYWIGTYGDGLFYYDGKRVVGFPLDKHEYLRYVNSIQEDNKGFFWISTNNGLFQILKLHLMNFPRRKEDLVYLHYNKHQGFNTNEFNGSSSYTSLKLGDGSLAFSSIDGVVVFDPNQMNYYLPERAIFLDDLYVNGELYTLKDSAIKIPNGFHRLNVKVTSAYFGSDNNINYEYSLNGMEWTSIRGDIIEFNELPSGNNKLEVRRKSSFNGAYQTLELNIYIIPYWWESTWFLIIMIFLGIYLIGLFVRMRLKILNQINDNLQLKVAQRTEDLKYANFELEQSQSQLQKQLSLQKLLNENISHDIKTPLRYLSYSLRKLKDKVNEGYVPEVKELKMLVESSEKIYHYTEMVTHNFKELLHLDHISYVDIEEVMKEKVAIFHHAIETNNISIHIDSSDVVLYSRKEILSTLIHNLLDNCIKNTHNSTIHLSAVDFDERVEIRISDTGKGFQKDLIDQYNQFLNNVVGVTPPVGIGVGFLMIKEILPILKATIEISINKYGGTDFYLVIQKELVEDEEE